MVLESGEIGVKSVLEILGTYNKIHVKFWEIFKNSVKHFNQF